MKELGRRMKFSDVPVEKQREIAKYLKVTFKER
jgi:hypothetical protein